MASNQWPNSLHIWAAAAAAAPARPVHGQGQMAVQGPAEDCCCCQATTLVIVAILEFMGF